LTIESNQMDDFLGKAIPSSIADETRQRRKQGQPEFWPSLIFNWIQAAAARGRGALVKNYSRPAALTACLFGLAWLGWSYIQRPAPTVRTAEINLPAQKTTEESQAQRAEAEGAQSLNTGEVRAVESAKPGLEAAKNEASPGIVEAAGKTRRLPAKPIEKLAKGVERLDRIGQKIAALLAVDPVVDHPLSATLARKREQSARGDAFDPSQHPNAPGAPRPLGTIRFTVPATKSSADYSYRQPAN
jgi:hypothetical protein